MTANTILLALTTCLPKLYFSTQHITAKTILPALTMTAQTILSALTTWLPKLFYWPHYITANTILLALTTTAKIILQHSPRDCQHYSVATHHMAANTILLALTSWLPTLQGFLEFCSLWLMTVQGYERNNCFFDFFSNYKHHAGTNSQPWHKNMSSNNDFTIALAYVSDLGAYDTKLRAGADSSWQRLSFDLHTYSLWHMRRNGTRHKSRISWFLFSNHKKKWKCC